MKLDLTCPKCAYCLITAEDNDFMPKMGKTATCKKCGAKVEVVRKNLQKHLSPEQREKAMALKAKAKAAVSGEQGSLAEPTAAPSPQPQITTARAERRKTPPPPRRQKSKPYREKKGFLYQMKKWAIIMLVLPVLVVFLTIFFGDNASETYSASNVKPASTTNHPQPAVTKQETQQAREERLSSGERAYAITYCKESIRSQLNFPETADFPFLDVGAKKIGKTYVVTSTVKAKNAFGVEMKHRWRCNAKHLRGQAGDRRGWAIKAWFE